MHLWFVEMIWVLGGSIAIEAENDEDQRALCLQQIEFRMVIHHQIVLFSLIAYRISKGLASERIRSRSRYK